MSLRTSLWLLLQKEQRNADPFVELRLMSFPNAVDAPRRLLPYAFGAAACSAIT